MKASNVNIKSNGKSYDRFVVCVGTAIINGPEIQSDIKVLDAFFNDVKAFNVLKGRELVRVYRPNGELVKAIP